MKKTYTTPSIQVVQLPGRAILTVLSPSTQQLGAFIPEDEDKKKEYEWNSDGGQ